MSGIHSREELWKHLAEANDPIKRRQVRKQSRSPHYPKDKCKDTQKYSDNKWRLAITSRICLCQVRIYAEQGEDPTDDSTHYRHEKKKFDVAYILKCWGYRFQTEAEFADGRRADVYILDGKSENGGAIEVETDQTIPNIHRKKDTWALPCLVIDPRESFGDTKSKIKEWLADYGR